MPVASSLRVVLQSGSDFDQRLHEDTSGAGSWLVFLEKADSVGWPVGEEGVANDPVGWDWSPVAAVVG
jgi:hypothetical protein